MEGEGSRLPGERDGLRIHLLGRFEVVRAGAPVPASAWRRRRPADLLKLVALAPGRSLGREAVVDALWPDKDPGSGANNLHRALYDLRQILGGRHVDIERGKVALVPEAWLDVDAFEAAAADGSPDALGTAVALYRGDLCPDDADADWLARRRAQLRGRFAEAALPLARAAAERGDPVALPLLRRLLAADPSIEEGHLHLVRLLAEAGRRAEALRQFDACDAALRAAGLGGPGDALRELRAAIQRGEIGRAPARPALDGARRAARRLLGTPEPGPVRGRGGLVLLLESLLETGHGTLVLLGERGVGKTRLAVEGARLALSRGATVLCGVAGAGAEGEPYAVFADAFLAERRARPEAPDPFAALQAPGRASPEATRRRVVEAVADALRELGGGKPLYLLLDDLHEADESSLDLLHVLARRARELRLVVVATCNEEALHAGTPAQAALAHLDGARLARGVRVPRLGLAAVRELAADVLGEQAPEPLVEQLYRVTDGSPLVAEELLRARREAPGAEQPADAAAAIRARLGRLGHGAATLLAAAAVAGQRFDFEVVRAVSGLTAHEALDGLERALAARLVDEDGAGYHFHHALVHEVLYEAVPQGRRAELHAAVADALEAGAAGGGEPPSELLAHHRLRAGRPELALRHLVAAGHRAAARAGLREALAFFAEALRLLARPGGGDAALVAEVLEATAAVQLALGELGGAARAFADAARTLEADRAGDPARRARDHRLGALALASGGAMRAASSEIDEGLEAAGEGDESPALLLLRARLLWHDGKLAEACAEAEASAARADALGDAAPATAARDLAAVAAASAPSPAGGHGDSLVLDPFASGVEDDARACLDLDLVLWERNLLGDRTAADLARAAAAFTGRMRARERLDAVAVGRHGTGVAALAAGDLELAEADLEEALRGHRGAGSSLGEALALERLATLRIVRGGVEEALALVDEGVLAAERGAIRRHALTRLYTTLARGRLAAGASHAAEDALREASASAVRHGTCATCDAALRATAVRVSLARGRFADAQAEAAQLEEVARLRGGRVLVAVSRLARARVLAAEGRTADAIGALSASRNAFFAAGLRLDAAICARIERRLRDPAEPLPGDVALLEKLVLADGDA
ncbi:MAG: AAA family ATPase [Anaeromyxobacteraceae bacterium]